MPWTDATFTQTTNDPQTGTLTLTYTDATEFPASDPFVYRIDRQRIQAGDLGAVRTVANAAMEAERTKRQNHAAKKAQLLTALNS